jgi:class 3 adenylate cyclase/HAMP domain-containing protein
MTIRRRLTSAFLTILVLFAVNQAFQLWSARLRAKTMATLDRALKRQVLMASLHETFENLQKQISLVGQVEGGGQAPEARRLFNEEVERATADIRQLKEVSDAGEQQAVTKLEQTYGDLADAWRKFFEYLGVEQGWALAYQVRAEPLSRGILGDLLPQLQRQQTDRLRQAQAEFASVTRLTERVTFAMFGISMVLAITVAYFIGRYLTAPLSELKLGAAMFGMNLDYRLAIDTTDEIGTVARTFNDMAETIVHARHQLTSANSELAARNTELERQRQVSQSLLLNVLPEQVATELAAEGRVTPRYFEDVTIVFTDFVGFTLSTEKMAAEELVPVLNGYFTAFDEIVGRYGLEKLKTIGDSYFCVGGLPVRTQSHPVDAVLAAFEMVHAVTERAKDNPAGWSVRIGIHTGPVIAGVVGIKKFAFDIWGDTVNCASRVESAGAPNRINISWAVYRRVKDFFAVESRGRVETKEHTDLEMYFVNGLLPGLQHPGAPTALPAFTRRYRTYFAKEPPACPACLFAGHGQPQRPAGARLSEL